MKRLLALLVLLAATLPAAPGPATGLARAQQAGPSLFEPGAGPPTPPQALLAAEAPGPAPAQVSLRCDQVLVDPTVSIDVSPSWREFRRARLFSADEFLSAPRSLSLVANRDDDPASGPDIDAVGQRLAIAANTAELYGSLSYYYAAGSPDPADELRVELYELVSGSLGPLIATPLVLTATDRLEGGWQQLTWEVADTATITRLRSLGQAALVFRMISGGNPGTTRLWLDDLTAYRCAPSASISGRVTRGGVAAAGALVLLVASDASGSSVVASTRAASDGAYSFLSAPVQPAGTSYRVWFLNDPAAPPRQAGSLGFWAGPLVPLLSEGDAVTDLALEVADVGALTPPSHATVVATDAAPAVLRWGARAAPVPGERHQLCLYDPARADSATGLPVQVCGPLIDPGAGERSFSLSPSSFAGTPSFGFTYGRSYRWYVAVYGGDPRTNQNVQYGYSFGERAITLVSAAAPEIGPPSIQPGDPIVGVAGAAWTLLIYMAADNALGDTGRAPGLGRPSGQLAGLQTLAQAYPNVNLVSYVDRYGPGGAQLCAYPATGAPDCRLRAEVNSADPATLATFIAFGRARYPAARTALLIVAPGQAAGHMALDETSAEGDDMSLGELEAAYQAAGLGGSAKLDLVIYQAPLLGSYEAIQTTAPYARYMVASPDQVWQLGAFAGLVPLLGGPSGGDAAAVARGAVAVYAARIGAVGGARAATWTAYDLGRAAGLGQAVDTLAEAVLAALSSEASTTRPALAAARSAAQGYDASGNGRLDRLATATGQVAANEDALVDLRDLAGELQLAVGPPAYVLQAASELAGFLDSPASSPIMTATIRSGQSIGGEPIDLAEARGLAIFFPSGDRLGGQPALAESYLYASALDRPGDSLWADLLRAYLGGVLGAGPGGVTAGAGGGAQFRPLPGGFVSTTLYLPVMGR